MIPKATLTQTFLTSPVMPLACRVGAHWVASMDVPATSELPMRTIDESRVRSARSGETSNVQGDVIFSGRGDAAQGQLSTSPQLHEAGKQK
jgi:hypothetical protein